nr:putative integron gene cassette protein [uncultured bacterium]
MFPVIKICQAILAVFLAVFLSALLPSPVYDGCAFVDPINRSWYFCNGGYEFVVGLCFSTCLFAIGPRQRAYYTFASIIVAAVAIISVYRVVGSIQDAFLDRATSITLLGAVAGVIVGISASSFAARLWVTTSDA